MAKCIYYNVQICIAIRVQKGTVNNDKITVKNIPSVRSCNVQRGYVTDYSTTLPPHSSNFSNNAQKEMWPEMGYRT